MENTEISSEIIASHGLTRDEFQKIESFLGRKPNLTELGVFSVMWSEHCSYKSSRVHLKKFPTKGPRVVQGPGENAGVVDIGDGQVAVFKMESHNHPSFIEPYQGAATGVGGILRDVFTMGARPIALMNSIRFGDLNHPKTKYLVEGVVAGIAGYGNSFGCPTVGGEVVFDDSYTLNPLVNAFCLGIADKDKIFLGRAKGVGNPVIYVGAKTGRDGIHGATMASAEFDDEAESKRPTVQVGDPFCEKLLLEACLELMQKKYLVGIQDMGAAGLTSSSVEMAARAGNGISINLDQVPAREEKMIPYEFLLSESQERMLLVVEKGFEAETEEIFKKWDLDCVVIGEVTDDGKYRVSFKGEEVVDIPVKALTEAAPVYDRPFQKPDENNTSVAENRKSFPWLIARGCATAPSEKYSDSEQPHNLNSVLLEMLASPNLCSRKWVYNQYDHQVRTNTVLLPGADAAVVRVKGTKKGLAMTTDCNSWMVAQNPRLGAQQAIAEAARNISCVGATPIAVTDCLNFGNPEKPEIMWQFKEAVEGLSEACKFFEIPVVSGNVSFYNETNQKGILPTPTIGMVGLIEDISKVIDGSFKQKGDMVIILGEGERRSLAVARDTLELDLQVQEAVRRLINERLLQSAHDVSDGGLVIALAESCFENEVGVKVKYEKDVSREFLYFGEAPARVIVSVTQQNLKEVQEAIEKFKVPYEILGETTASQFLINNDISLTVKDMKSKWENGFEQILKN